MYPVIDDIGITAVHSVKTDSFFCSGAPTRAFKGLDKRPLLIMDILALDRV